jgi:hypothetical protein
MQTDQDLGGDDLKLVDWWVVYMKPDQERVIANGTKTISYPTAAISLSAQIVAPVVVKANQELTAQNQSPLEDKYIEFRFAVANRFAKRPKEYEKLRTVDTARIADVLEGISKQFRPGTGV